MGWYMPIARYGDGEINTVACVHLYNRKVVYKELDEPRIEINEDIEMNPMPTVYKCQTVLAYDADTNEVITTDGEHVFTHAKRAFSKLLKAEDTILRWRTPVDGGLVDMWSNKLLTYKTIDINGYRVLAYRRLPLSAIEAVMKRLTDLMTRIQSMGITDNKSIAEHMNRAVGKDFTLEYPFEIYDYYILWQRIGLFLAQHRLLQIFVWDNLRFYTVVGIPKYNSGTAIGQGKVGRNLEFAYSKVICYRDFGLSAVKTASITKTGYLGESASSIFLYLEENDIGVLSVTGEFENVYFDTMNINNEVGVADVVCQEIDFSNIKASEKFTITISRARYLSTIKLPEIVGELTIVLPQTDKKLLVYSHTGTQVYPRWKVTKQGLTAVITKGSV